mmetsp:Transcript_128945/g.223688  ORF Transcript_128945/g.223688 Transcript_128945/m.223688 type:complete len:321 (+) Transcript_128945:102-1064(+)
MWSAITAVSRRARQGCRPCFEAAATSSLVANASAFSPAASSAIGRAGHAPVLQSSIGSVRGFYFPRRNWFPWRQRIVHQRQAALRRKRHIWPRQADENEAPIFGGTEDGQVIAFREKEVRLGMKRLLEYARIIRKRQLQDAVDWVESMARLKSEPILKMLQTAKQECIERHKLDISRLYIFDAQPQRGYFVKSIRQHARGRFGINKSPRNMFMIRVREMPLEEYFHRLYIYNKVPRSLAADMRLALLENRVSPQTAKEWAPYLCANSRILHRRELKWLDSTRQFDYYQARREWIQRYKANLLRASTEAREARGLPPLAAE